MSRARAILEPVHRGEQVVLVESFGNWLIKAGLPLLGAPPLLGLALWMRFEVAWGWKLGLAGPLLLLCGILWRLRQRSRTLTVSTEGLVLTDADGSGEDYVSVPWSDIETFGTDETDLAAGADRWILVITKSKKYYVDTFRLNRKDLRDALNELLVKYNPDSTRALFEAELLMKPSEQAGEGEEQAPQDRFTRPRNYQEAYEETLRLVGEYYHPDCNTVTGTTDRLIRKLALDPFAFPLTMPVNCEGGCQGALSRDVVGANGQSLYDLIRDMRAAVPRRARHVRNLLGPLLFVPPAILGTIYLISLFPDPVDLSDQLQFFALTGFGSLALGGFLSPVFFRKLRRADRLW